MNKKKNPDDLIREKEGEIMNVSFTKEDLPTWPITVRKYGSTSLVIQER